MSIPISQFILPPIFPSGNHKFLFYICDSISVNHKKVRNNTICSDMEGPRDYHTEWSKSDREKQMSYDISLIWGI